jgi:hypothetical protein
LPAVDREGRHQKSLYESLGAPDLDASARLGGAAYALIVRLARTVLASARP